MSAALAYVAGVLTGMLIFAGGIVIAAYIDKHIWTRR